MALALAASLEAARQSARLDLTGVPAGAATYTITRTSPSGNTAGVRGAVDAPVSIPEQIAHDWELPFGVDLAYQAEIFDAAGTVLGTAAATFRLDWADCDAWFVDLARPTNSLAQVIVSMTELTFEVAASVHRVLNRRAPVLTSLPAWTPSTELIMLTETLSERDQMRALLGAGYPFLLRTAPIMGVGNLYLGILGFVEERFISLGADPKRQFHIQCVQVERPDPALFVPTPPMTYQQVNDSWASYAALKAAVGTYDQLAYTFPAGGGSSPVIPWLPDDI